MAEEKLRRELKKGTIVITDKGTTCENEVEVVSQTPNFLFTRVKPVGKDDFHAWSIMTCRLTLK